MKEEELKKEIEKLKKKVHKRLGTSKCPDKDYEDDDNWESWWCGDIMVLEAKLKSFQEGRQSKLKGYVKIEDLKQIMYGKIDWIKVFKDAYESRKGAWRELGHISEWRNATDEVLFAVWKQISKELAGREE